VLLKLFFLLNLHIEGRALNEPAKPVLGILRLNSDFSCSKIRIALSLRTSAQTRSQQKYFLFCKTQGITIAWQRIPLK
jgi:hypothetical protein